MAITACEALARVRRLTDALKAKAGNDAAAVRKEDLDRYITDVLEILADADVNLPQIFRR